MPWRETNDPYRIWVSEVILQQTRVAQGWDYYLRFIQRFPDVQTLAAASEEEVLLLWQGLGYYSRARNMHAAARDIMERFNGKFPVEHQDILSLKGIGDYTAAAISSIAYNAPYAAVDGNVLRVIARLFAVDDPINTTKGKRLVGEISQSLLPVESPADFNQAIMDFGSMICTPTLPQCERCPLQDFCMAYSLDRVAEIPVSTKKRASRTRFFNYLHILKDGDTYIAQRIKDDIWRNLYEFPLVETDSATKTEELIRTDEFKELFEGATSLQIDSVASFKHVLSHQQIQAHFFRVVLPSDFTFSPPAYLLQIQQTDLNQYPLAQLTRKYLEYMEES